VWQHLKTSHQNKYQNLYFYQASEVTSSLEGPPSVRDKKFLESLDEDSYRILSDLLKDGGKDMSNRFFDRTNRLRVMRTALFLEIQEKKGKSEAILLDRSQFICENVQLQQVFDDNVDIVSSLQPRVTLLWKNNCELWNCIVETISKVVKKRIYEKSSW